jgi:hypothetical protein
MFFLLFLLDDRRIRIHIWKDPDPYLEPYPDHISLTNGSGWTKNIWILLFLIRITALYCYLYIFICLQIDRQQQNSRQQYDEDDDHPGHGGHGQGVQCATQ